MSSKLIKIIIAVTGLLIIVVGAFSGGFLAGNVFQKYTNESNTTTVDGISAPTQEIQDTETPKAQPSTPIDLRDLFKPFWKTWEIVHEQYVDQPVDDTLLMRGAIQGMLEALGDEHTSYIDPEMLRQANIQLDGEYEGIGVWVDITGEYLTIISPMPESPAEKAGLKPEDKIIAINGEDMTGLDGNVVLKKILGPAGSKVTLTILRKDETEGFDVTITRAKITVPSVAGEMLEDNIAYIEIFSFGDTTGAELQTTLKDLLKNEPVGLVVDLRFNGGGLLTSAIDVASQFISEDIVMYEEYGDGSMKAEKTRKNGLAREIPLVVLVNEGTASASEIVAGAIQDYGRGKLVGVQTYGKGSVQNWIELDDDQGAVRVTIARWLTPLQRQINGIGLTPDLIVELTEEDAKNEKDPQLDQAIQLLTGY